MQLLCFIIPPFNPARMSQFSFRILRQGAESYFLISGFYSTLDFILLSR